LKRSKQGQNEPGANHTVREASPIFEIDVTETTENK